MSKASYILINEQNMKIVCVKYKLLKCELSVEKVVENL